MEHVDGKDVSPWVIAVLAPVCVWSLTWALTTGLAHLADTCMGGMCGVARLLFPVLPVKGVSHEDVAVSLVKSMASGTVDDATWTRPGLWFPAWMLQGMMHVMFGLALASTSIAASLAQSQAWMTACGASQALLFVLCLLITLPVGASLIALKRQAQAAFGDARGRSSPSNYKDTRIFTSTTSSSTALAIKLAGALAWPCISARAVGSALTTDLSAVPPFSLAISRVVAAGLTLTVVLTIGLATARFARGIGLGTAGDAATVDFGLQVGTLCAAQAAVSALQLLLCLGGGGLPVREVAGVVVSILVLLRVAYTTWLLQREMRPSSWLQLLTLDALLSSRRKAADA